MKCGNIEALVLIAMYLKEAATGSFSCVFTENPDKIPEDQSSSTVSLHQYSCPLQRKQSHIAEKVRSALRLRSGLRHNVFLENHDLPEAGSW